MDVANKNYRTGVSALTLLVPGRAAGGAKLGVFIKINTGDSGFAAVTPADTHGGARCATPDRISLLIGSEGHGPFPNKKIKYRFNKTARTNTERKPYLRHCFVAMLTQKKHWIEYHGPM